MYQREADPQAVAQNEQKKGAKNVIHTFKVTSVRASVLRKDM